MILASGADDPLDRYRGDATYSFINRAGTAIRRTAVDGDHSARRDDEPEIGVQTLGLGGAAARVADVSIGTFGHRVDVSAKVQATSSSETGTKWTTIVASSVRKLATPRMERRAVRRVGSANVC